MRKWLLLLGLCCCGIDDRSVTVRKCVPAPEGGELAAFSTARLGRCTAPICADEFTGSQIVALGSGDVAGRVIPLQASPNSTLLLGLRGDLSLERDDTDALRVALQLDTLAVPEAGTLTAAFGLRLDDCLDVGNFTSLSFSSEGKFGECPLSVALRFGDETQEVAASACTIDPVSGARTCATSATTSVDVSPGVTSLPFLPNASRDTESGLVAVEWQASLDATPPRRCDLAFTIDDIRLDR